jgi:hypothetical protein
MHKIFLGSGLIALTLGFGLTGTQALVLKPSLPTLESAATPAAMCGRSCRNGGRYIPGPPEVCYQQGLEYCGSSREAPTVVAPPSLYIGPGGIGIDPPRVYQPRRERDCRTRVRPDGSTVTICD